MTEATEQEHDENEGVPQGGDKDAVDEQSATPTAAEPSEPQDEDELKRVMVIGAHPDDPEFGAGGTIAKLAAQGKEIVYVLATSGDKGSHDPAVRPGQLATRREQEQRDAAAVLGVKEVIYLRYADGI